MLYTYVNSLRKFIQQEFGAVVIIYTIALIPIFGFLGLSVDLARTYYVHAIITGAVDAASVAGAKALGSNAQDVEKQARAIFDANIPSNMDATIQGPIISVASDGTYVKVSADARVQTYFMKLLGQYNLTSGATAQALVSNPGSEVVLALDNTGSMSGSPMSAEIQAAKKLVQIVYGGKDTIKGLYMSVIPYTTTVNIGMPGFDAKNWLTSAGVSEVGNTNLYPNIAPTGNNVGGRWMGCIEVRTPPIYSAGMDTTDTPPTNNATKFTPFLYPSTMVHSYAYGQPFDRSKPTQGNPPWGGKGKTRGDNDWELDGTTPSSSLKFGDNFFSGNNGVGPNLGCPVAILPLTASQSVVQAKLDEMKATSRGGTMINIGLAAAWWAISPRWVGMWPGTPSTLPGEYLKTRKFLILMTDGQNQWYDWPGGVPGSPETVQNYKNDADYTGYGRLGEGRAGTTNFNQTIPMLNARMASMCNTIKNNGVVIYTILFAHNSNIGQSTQDLFKSCASDPSKYFYSISDKELLAAFENIGKSISTLRLTWPGEP